MLETLAQSAENQSVVPLTYVIAGFTTVAGLGGIVVTFLWHQHLKNLKRLERLEANYASLTGFTSAIMGMTLNGDTIQSKTVRALFDRFKPNDGSGIHDTLRAE